VADVPSRMWQPKARQIAARGTEELLPFLVYFINKKHLWATMFEDALPGNSEVADQYRRLTAEDLGKRIAEEHERARLLDEKTSKMTLFLALGLTILGSVVAVLLRDVGASPIAVAMKYGLLVSILFVFIGGYIALTSLGTMPTFGYGTAFCVKAKTAAAPTEVVLDALLRQETANQIRQVRNEAAFQSLRNGCFVFAVVLILYLFTWTRATALHRTPPQPCAPLAKRSAALSSQERRSVAYLASRSFRP
jgi:hypothetical protein